jgi:hypothetical protein
MCFHMNFRIYCSISVKNHIGDFDGACIELVDCFL